MEKKRGGRRPSFVNDGESIKKGLLTKSPPSYIFNNRSSWKSRIFKLCKTTENKYFLKYYTSNGLFEVVKGTIDFTEIKAVAWAKQGIEKLDLVLRILSPSTIGPENVMYIKTEKRDYYFVDENKEEIESWYKSISDAWMEINKQIDASGPVITHAEPLERVSDMDTRPKSFPSNHPKTENKTTEDDRHRANTDSAVHNPMTKTSPNAPRQRSETTTVPQNESPERMSHFLFPEQGATSAYTLKDKEAPVRDYDSDEGIYDTPRISWQSQDLSKEFSDQQDSSNASSDPNSEEDCQESEEDTYEPMHAATYACSPSEDKVSTDHEITDKPTNKDKIRRRKHGSRLPKTLIFKLKYESQSVDLETLTIKVPKEHLQKYFALHEVGDHLCVSKWKGPTEIRCLFHHGDQIDEINNETVNSSENFFQILANSTDSEVTLAITRNPRTEIFHVEECNCDIF